MLRNKGIKQNCEQDACCWKINTSRPRKSDFTFKNQIEIKLKLLSGAEIVKDDLIVSMSNVMVGDENDAVENMLRLIEEEETNEDVI